VGKRYGSGWLRDDRSLFLNELDGFAQNAVLLTIATTNHPHKLDRSILDRPSRFDRKFHFPLPMPCRSQVSAIGLFASASDSQYTSMITYR